MGKLGIILCLVILSLDAGAGSVSFQAENALNKAKRMKFVLVECKKPSPAAFMLGLVAATLLVVAHILANVIGRCSCMQLAVACNICNWIIFLAGFFMIAVGTMTNHKSRTSCGLVSLTSFGSVGSYASSMASPLSFITS
ncbi:hypothetical protein SAY86_011035 [Trapa natans]|uniref:Uncharacterized protein n=1 Tax=Trapa natans TaxID=22666 RepID=A0AAN7R2E2_TRANT|nr:hypothetical protein SAY86_011035 [Trapa natans]